jgi:hypothetical protein
VLGGGLNTRRRYALANDDEGVLDIHRLYISFAVITQSCMHLEFDQLLRLLVSICK